MPRRSIAVLAVVAAIGALLGVPASTVQAKSTGLELLAAELPPMLPGQRGWVGILWTATADVCDVQVTASGPSMTITYPANTATYSSLFQNSSMPDGGIDFSSVNIALDPKAKGALTITLAVAYRVVPPGHAGDATWCKGAARTTASETATLPVQAYSGPAFTQRTTTATVAQKTPAWIRLAFAGYAPGLTAFQVSLRPPPGLTVRYPNEGTAAGLNAVGTLPVGYEDYVSVYLDATAAAPGRYTVPITVTAGGTTSTGSLAITVT